jgi:hypothetical protein
MFVFKHASLSPLSRRKTTVLFHLVRSLLLMSPKMFVFKDDFLSPHKVTSAMFTLHYQSHFCLYSPSLSILLTRRFLVRVLKVTTCFIFLLRVKSEMREIHYKNDY